MLDREAASPLAKFFRICRARQVAYGWTIYLQQARSAARETVATERQKRIALLARLNQARLAA